MKKVYAITLLAILTWGLHAQPLTGTKNIPGDYASIAAAVADLNTNGVGVGGVTFNVAAGHTETILSTIVLTATGTAANPIVFQKSGVGANPQITAYTGTSTPTSASPDGIWALSGSDYVTIDGIDLLDPNAANPATMEFGLALFKASAADGCQNVTIKNCTITLNRVNNASGSGPMVEGSVGILVINSTRTAATTALTPSAASGSNSNNKFYGNTIQNCNYGIALSGFAATAGVGPNPDPLTFLGDLNNDIGGTSASTGNTILNYGGASSATNPAAGIRANNQWSINISYNTLNNNDGAGVNHPNTLRGIFAQAGTSANATISYNNVTIKGGGTTQQVAAIESGIGNTPASNTVNITNNTITGEYLTATSGAFYGIYNNNAAPATLNITNNSVTNLSYSTASLTGSGAVYPIYTTGSNAASTFNVNNNTVNNISRTGTTGGTTIGIFVSGGVSGMVVNVNNNVVSNMSIGGSGSSSDMYGIQVPTSTLTVNDNQVYNLTVAKSTGTGEMNGIRSFASPTIETYSNNLVYNLTHNGPGTVRGIYAFTTTGTRTMAGNTVHTISGAGLTIAGIHNVSSSPNVYKNKVYNIQSTNSTGNPTVSGMILGNLGTAGTANIYNNLIADIKAPNAGISAATAPAVRGINITTSTVNTTISLSYNTVYLDASSSNTNFGSAALFVTASTTATTAALTMRNNIFVNVSTANGTGRTVAYQRSGTALANFASASNNNLFYAGTPSTTNLIFFDGTNSDQTLSDYKARVAPRDAASVTENPNFQSISGSSADFLKIDLNIPTQIESGGVPILGITDDYYGTTRSASTPDIGGFEGNMTPLDLVGPSISYTTLSNDIVATSRVLTGFATITDPSGVETSAGLRPRLYYKKSTDSNDYVGNTSADNGWKFVEASNTSSPFDFTVDYTLLNGGGVSVGDVIQYFVVAQDMAPTPNVGINSGTFNTPPTSVALVSGNFPISGAINSFNIVSSISGMVTVGSGGDYPSLTGAGGLFEDINSKIVSGNIVAEILDNLTETGANALNQFSESGGPWTLTIRPADASSKTISGSFAGGLIRLNGADRVTIDGRFGGSGSWLTFQNTSTSSSAVFMLISSGAGQGATNNTIRNCTISTGTIAATTYGIHLGGSTLGSSGADNDDNSILNNTITVASNGIYAFGTSSTSSGGLDNLTISGNSVTCSTSVAAIGIRVSNVLGSTISGNEVDVQQSTSNAPVGISLETGVSNTMVSSNVVKRSAYTGSVGYGGRGITVGTGSTSSNITLANNVVYGVTGDNWSAFGNSSSMGIAIGVIGNSSTLTTTTGGINLYYNSVNMYNTYTRAATSTITTALYVGSGASNLDIRNNVFANSMDNLGNTTSKSYAIYSAAAASAFTTINYNDYYPSGPEGVLGFISSADVTTLTAWQTATGQDANSISADPLFNSNTNLSPQPGSPLVGAGTPISGITVDFLGTSRSATTPTIGAYEQVADLAAPAISYTALSNGPVGTSRVLTGFATITDVSGVNTTSGTRPRIYYKKSSDNNTFAGNTSSDNGWKFVEASNTSSPFNFTIDYTLLNGGAVSAGDVIQYFVVAQDLAPTPNVGINSGTFATAPTSVALTAANFPIGGTINQYSIATPLSGTVTVGTGGTYATLTGTGGLFEAVNNSLLGGDLIAEIISDITEPGTVALNEFGEVSPGGYTITIRPDDADPRLISGSFAGGLIRLNGADRVTIDGRFGGSGEYLRIVNSSTSSSAACIWLISPSAGNGATNNVIRNCILEGGSTSGTLAAIVSSGPTIGTAALAPNSDNLYTENIIRKALYGIVLVGPTSAEDNNLVSFNQIVPLAVGDSIGHSGIFVSNQSNISVVGNTITGILANINNNDPAAIAVAGIQSGGTIARNIIDNAFNFHSNAWGMSGIRLASTSSSTNLSVVNNSISNIRGRGWTGNRTDNGVGIRLESGGGYLIAHNSINLVTNQPNAANSSGVLVHNITTSGNVLQNNVIANQMTTGTRYAVAIESSSLPFSTINFNNYFAQNIGMFGNTNITTLTAWQTATGQDGMSISRNPSFTSSTDLTPTDFNGYFAQPISGITTDITGATRSATAPAKGAYEGTVPGVWLGSTAAWTNTANWSHGAVPTASTVVAVINSSVTQPEISSAVNLDEELLIATGCTLTVKAGGSLTMGSASALANNGNVLLEATASGYGSLLEQAVRGSGTFTRQMYLNASTGPNNARWYTIGSPFAVPINQLHDGTSEFNVTSATESPLRRWDASTGDYVLPASATENFIRGLGYVAYFGNSPFGTFIRPIPGAVSLTGNYGSAANLTATLGYTNTPTFPTIDGPTDGWNCLANPYLTSYDWNGQTLGPNTGAAIYIRNSTNTGWVAWNTSETSNRRYIPPMQGFWIRTTVSEPLTADIAQRSTNSTQVIEKPGAGEVLTRIKVTNTANGYDDQAVISFHNSGTPGFDRLYDGYKLRNDAGMHNVYSRSGMQSFALNYLPAFTGTASVPVWFESDVQGTFTFHINRDEIDPTIEVTLEDKQTNATFVFQNNQSAYTFTHTPQMNKDRFVLHYNQINVGQHELISSGIKGLQAWYFDGRIHLKSLGFSGPVTARLVDVSGKRIAEEVIAIGAGELTRWSIPSLRPGVYMVQLISREGQTTVKFVY
ncbi:hypothetical protein [Schleiferia thermophila]|uniref:hypothetical protein n=1 Tax=Schleiferia thermophila TaxID=884107 RepID=UPI003EED87FF